MNEEVGDTSKVMVVLRPVKAVTATTPSPPGRFSITTDWPHFAASRSPSSRAVMSTPAPGPSGGEMNRTGRCGQAALMLRLRLRRRRHRRRDHGQHDGRAEAPHVSCRPHLFAPHSVFFARG